MKKKLFLKVFAEVWFKRLVVACGFLFSTLLLSEQMKKNPDWCQNMKYLFVLLVICVDRLYGLLLFIFKLPMYFE